MRNLSIRVRLFLLVITITLPFLALLAWFLNVQLQAESQVAYLKMKAMAETVSHSLDIELQDQRLVMARLAARPQIKILDAKNCDPFLPEYISLHRDYINLSINDFNGNLICVFSEESQTKPILTEEQLQALKQHGKFFVGGAIIDEQSKNWTATLAYPIIDTHNQFNGYLSLPLDLLTLNERFFKSCAIQYFGRCHRPKRKFLITLFKTG